MNYVKSWCSNVLLGSALFFMVLPASSLKEGPQVQLKVDLQKGHFELPPLPYPYNGLEPYIDQTTMHLHHDKHHKAYVDNLNKAIKSTLWEDKTLPELFENSSSLPTAIRNNAGGHWNHSFYWEIMTDDPEKRKMSDRMKDALIKNFGSVEHFKEEFRNAGLARFGSGYAWLVKTPDGKLVITSTANQDNPLMNTETVQGTPVLVCDVWEHAYYLKYHNLRGDYLDSFWNVVNWKKVDDMTFNK